MGPVEVIISVERRRHWSAGQKQAMVEDGGCIDATISGHPAWHSAFLFISL
jgi:hypothetical protein